MSPGAPHTQWLWQSIKKQMSCPPQDDTLNTSRVLVLPNKPFETVSQRVVTEEKAPPTEVSIVRQKWWGAHVFEDWESYRLTWRSFICPVSYPASRGAQSRTDSNFLFHWLDSNKLQSYFGGGGGAAMLTAAPTPLEFLERPEESGLAPKNSTRFLLSH